MGRTIYIRMRHRVQVQPHQMVVLNDVAQIIADDEMLNLLKELEIYQVSPKDKNTIIMDVMVVIKEISRIIPGTEIQVLGPSQTIIEVVLKKRKVSVPLFFLVWLLLFFGSALAIMNFHDDVSMQSVHQRLYKMITGKEVAQPLIFQIPYSLGLGLGMILFFNHIFQKRFNEEPSPLEVEMFNYQQDLDNYVIMYENKETLKKLDDH
ncbi:stage V sporulation protein AA [Cytobacillus sp. Hz8]|uniref:stage V sporulation protein AA n=1 Tax=Cytobacillus sp. Hz8 TaxID=3347168 RepID=UPI0035E0E416